VWPIAHALAYVLVLNGAMIDAKVVEGLQLKFEIGILFLKWKEKS
jgi:hypothetical protein